MGRIFFVHSKRTRVNVQWATISDEIVFKHDLNTKI